MNNVIKKDTKQMRVVTLTIMYCAALTLVALTFSSSPVSAESDAKNTDTKNSYVSWANGYHFTVPDDWRKIERFNVEEFLRFHGKDPATVPHDAFFCPKDAEPFWSKSYLFVTTEKSENSFDLADSLLQGMASEFDSMVKSQDSLGPITRMTSRKPTLDRKAKTITQVSNLNVQGVDQVMRLVMKFHKSGITTFYFYSRADLYKHYEPTFADMVASFSDENLADAEGGDSVSIVNVSDVNTSETKAAEPQEAPEGEGFLDLLNNKGTFLGALFAIIAYILYVRMKRKQGGR
jgi:hypothetical protein